MPEFGPDVGAATGVPDPTQGGDEGSRRKVRLVRGAGTLAGATIQHGGARRKANAQQALKIAGPQTTTRTKRRVRV